MFRYISVYIFFPIILFPTYLFATNVGINGTGCIYSTIQEAVNWAIPGDTLKVSVGTYNERVIIERKNLTVSGNYDSTCSTKIPGTTTIDSDGQSGKVFSVRYSDVILNNLMITGGDSNGIHCYSADVTLDGTSVFLNSGSYGAGVSIDRLCTLRLTNNSRIHDNTAIHLGGGVRVASSGKLLSSDSDIYNNSAGRGGSGIDVYGGTVILSDSDLYNNQVTTWPEEFGGYGTPGGGAILSRSGSSVSLEGNTNIYNNNVAYHGGGIHAINSTITFSGPEVSIISNHASQYGGAIYLEGNSTLNVSQARIGADNIADENTAVRGAGVYADRSVINFDNAILAYNRASMFGGGVHLINSTLNAVNMSSMENYADFDGGAIYADSSNISIYVDPTSCNPAEHQCGLFMNNHADYNTSESGSGGAIFSRNSTLSVDQIYFSGNSAALGGAIYQTGSSAAGTVKNSLLYGNSISGTNGSAILINDGEFNLFQSTLASNSGAFAYSTTSLESNTILNSIISDNIGGGTEGTVTESRCNIDQSGNVGSVTDPLFVSLSGGNYRLQEGSPAIDACPGIAVSVDIENKRRPVGSAYDIGAYEYGVFSNFPWDIFLPSILGSSNSKARDNLQQ